MNVAISSITSLPLVNEIDRKQTAVLEPKPIANWIVIPTDWAGKAKAQDMPLLYKSSLH